jgi:hypothetical protein
MITGAPANVLDFAADPTGVSDSSTAIQAALNSGAAHIHIPKGYYRIDTTLTAPTTVSIISGDGVNGTRLWSNTANGQYVLALGGTSVNLRDFRVYGGNQETTPITTPTGRYGLSAVGTGNQFSWERIAVYGFDLGAYVGALSSTVYMCMFNHLDFALCNTGMRVDQGMHQSTWLNCQFRSNVNYGLRFDPTGVAFEMVANAIYNCTFERTSSGAGAGLYLNNVRGFDISACYFEGNKDFSVIITGTPENGSQGVSIHNCYFFQFSSFFTPAAGGHGIQVSGPYVFGVSIENNHFEDYNFAGFFPVRLLQLAGETTFLNNNVFNNSANEIRSDFAYLLNDFGAINDHVIAREQGLTDGSGNLVSKDLVQIALGNISAEAFLQITIVQCTSNMTTVDSTTVVRMKAAQSAGSVVLAVGAGIPAGMTFSVGTTSTISNSYIANLRVSIAGGNANTNVGFIVETAIMNNAKIGGLSTIPRAFS